MSGRLSDLPGRFPGSARARLPCAEATRSLIRREQRWAQPPSLSRQQRVGAEHWRITPARPAYLDLARLQASGSSLVPVFIPVSPDRPLQPIPLTRSQALTVFDPNLVTPYVQNLTLSVTRSLSSNVTLDVRYVGTLARKQFYGTLFNLNIPNFRSNGLKEAFDVVRAGGESALLNNIFTGQTVDGQAFNGTNAGAQMRASTTFANNLANGNYVGLANSLNTLSTSACSANCVGRRSGGKRAPMQWISGEFRCRQSAVQQCHLQHQSRQQQLSFDASAAHCAAYITVSASRRHTPGARISESRIAAQVRQTAGNPGTTLG